MPISVPKPRVDTDAESIFENKWLVIFWDDDKTTFEFVISLLVAQFGKTTADATDLAYQIDRIGRGIAGYYNREVAETKAVISTEIARKNGFPLKITVEERHSGF